MSSVISEKKIAGVPSCLYFYYEETYALFILLKLSILLIIQYHGYLHKSLFYGHTFSFFLGWYLGVEKSDHNVGL